jgi:lipoprotein-releasing system permease protein
MALGAEAFVAWRYLYRRRQSRVVPWVALAALLCLGLSQYWVYSGGHQQLGAVLTIPSALTLATCLLYSCFSVFITVSVLGVVMGVAALTVVLSVTSGFQESFRHKILGVNAHVLVLKYGQDFSEYRDIAKRCASDARVKAVAPFVFNQMMIAHGSALSGLLVKGIDAVDSPRVLDIAEKLTEGRIEELTSLGPARDGGEPLPAIFIGRELKKRLKAELGDRGRIVSPRLELEPSSATEGPPSRDFRVAGVFYSGFDEYDRRLAYVNLPEAQAFYQAGDVVTGVEMKLHQVDEAPEVARELLRAIGGTPYRVIDWEQLNHNLFTALFWQKLALTLFLGLIVLVAAFNIVAAMTMLVVEKTREVAILKSMGMSDGRLAAVFQVAGLVIGGVGALSGLLVGLLCCGVLSHYEYPLDGSVYLIDTLPVLIHPMELVITVAAAVGVSLLATVYPAIRSARLQPVDGLRYE